MKGSHSNGSAAGIVVLLVSAHLCQSLLNRVCIEGAVKVLLECTKRTFKQPPLCTRAHYETVPSVFAPINTLLREDTKVCSARVDNRSKNGRRSPGFFEGLVPPPNQRERLQQTGSFYPDDVLNLLTRRLAPLLQTGSPYLPGSARLVPESLQ